MASDPKSPGRTARLRKPAGVEALTGVDPVRPADRNPRRVWYTAYGSNTHPDRLACYVKGGRLPGTTREHPGCRDPRMPSRCLPIELNGAVYFATESPVWGGGRAFYDPYADGRVPARGYPVSAAQFSDIAAQEMYRAPGRSLDLAEVITDGRAVLGEGRYETLICAGRIEELPVLTFTAPWRMTDVPWNPPSAAYVRYLASGLLSAGVWDLEAVASYLAACPGAAGHWSVRAVTELMGDGAHGG
ncbi:hypothetical protein GCM10010421_04050 [Streptomyces glaucus]|uniref:Histone deacetylase n=1 Tax=Streptomyces glaucus TaxID=284029 RepID=A0ABN3J4K1_9ACTN